MKKWKQIAAAGIACLLAVSPADTIFAEDFSIMTEEVSISWPDSESENPQKAGVETDAADTPVSYTMEDSSDSPEISPADEENEPKEESDDPDTPSDEPSDGTEDEKTPDDPEDDLPNPEEEEPAEELSSDDAKERISLVTCTIWVSDVVYSGEEEEPEVILIDANGMELTEGADYIVSCEDDTTVGTGTVTVTGTGDYEGTLTESFQILLEEPQLIDVVTGKNQAEISWEPVPGAESYILYYREGSRKWKKIKTGITKTSFTHKATKAFPLDMGKKYTYTVEAVCGKVHSGYDEEGLTIAIKPAAVKKLKAEAVNYNTVKLTWQSASNADGYVIYRRSGNQWKKIGSTKKAYYYHVGTETDPVTPGVKYTYNVRAFSSADGRAYSAYAKKNVQAKTKPDQPVLVSATFVSGKKIKIRWNKALGATGYLILRKDAKGKWQQVAKVSGKDKESFIQVSSKKFPIQKNKTYTYTVQAYTAKGNTHSSYNKKGITVKKKAEENKNVLKARKNAAKLVKRLTNSKMTQSEKLEACFRWCMNRRYRICRDFTRKDGWTGLYANDYFDFGYGDCNSGASAFSYMAKALGYKDVYVVTNTKKVTNREHSWTEINGKIYDSHYAKRADFDTYYGGTYGSSGLRQSIVPVLRTPVK